MQRTTPLSLVSIYRRYTLHCNEQELLDANSQHINRIPSTETWTTLYSDPALRCMRHCYFVGGSQNQQMIFMTLNRKAKDSTAVNEQWVKTVTLEQNKDIL